VSRANRLLDLIQILRRHRYPVSGAALASELGISLRTLYRDISTLQAQGATIDGAPGLGYVLRPGFMLPPLMFSHEEIEALALGSRWVADRADPRLAKSAQDALAKIAAVLPEDLRRDLETSALLIGPGPPVASPTVDLAVVRHAIRTERKVDIEYVDMNAARTSRTVWPIALGFFDRASVLVAWCELRDAFRHFRTDRIESLQPQDVRYPRRRQLLTREWRAALRASADEAAARS
jgi:predicted DNA-binding transcriptional regulator YafY